MKPTAATLRRWCPQCMAATASDYCLICDGETCVQCGGPCFCGQDDDE